MHYEQGLTSFQSFLKNQSSPIEIKFLLTVKEKEGIMLVARSKMFHFLCLVIDFRQMSGAAVYNIIRK